MHLYYENVNDALIGITKGFHTGLFEDNPTLDGLPPIFQSKLEDLDLHLNNFHSAPMTTTQSRNGQVITIEEPVTITYRNPRQRVLFNTARDANPFFHLIEALWMLAGRNDVAPLAHFNSEMTKFSDDGETFWGAYGYRWGCQPSLGGKVPAGFFPHPDYSEGYPGIPQNYSDNLLSSSVKFLGLHHNQLDDCIELLAADPTTRRVVLQMWSNEDLYRLTQDYTKNCKDVPCNLTIMFRPRVVVWPDSAPPGEAANLSKLMKWGTTEHYLDMTVTNRSNDMLLGCLGANYVHFSFLLEYVALAAGYKVGHYHQFTNNLHVYTSPKEDGADWLPMKCQPEALLSDIPRQMTYTKNGDWPTIPLFEDRDCFDACVMNYFTRELWKATDEDQFLACQWDELFFKTVVIPMTLAFNHHKKRDYVNATIYSGQIGQGDWYTACGIWLDKRERSWLKAQADGPVQGT